MFPSEQELGAADILGLLGLDVGGQTLGVLGSPDTVCISKAPLLLLPLQGNVLFYSLSYFPFLRSGARVCGQEQNSCRFSDNPHRDFLTVSQHRQTWVVMINDIGDFKLLALIAVMTSVFPNGGFDFNGKD